MIESPWETVARSVPFKRAASDGERRFRWKGSGGIVLMSNFEGRKQMKTNTAMKRAMVSVSILGALLLLVPPMVYSQQQGPSPQGQAGWNCPGMQMGGGWHGSKGYGHGRGHGRGMGKCGLGIGRMMHDNQGKPLTKEQADQVFQRYVEMKNNPNLKLGEVMEKGDLFEATVTTQEGSLVEKVELNRNTGWFRNLT
jgi:hypothetical protein